MDNCIKCCKFAPEKKKNDKEIDINNIKFRQNESSYCWSKRCRRTGIPPRA